MPLTDISILGRIGYDLYAEQHGVPLKDVRTFARYLGGSSANAAVGLARLGMRVGIISCLGTDALSDYLLEYLAGEGVDTELVRRREGCRASLCLTEVSPPDSFPQVFYRERAADTLVEVRAPEKAFIADTRLFVTNGTSLCASPSREATLSALEWARRSGVKTAFDVDYRDMSWNGPEEARLYARLALQWVDVLIANPKEIRLLTGRDDLRESLDLLRAWPVPLIAAKLGSEGTLVVDSRQSLFLPPYPVKVVSTIGAGDGFAAGFLYALTAGMDLGTSLRYGNAAAALVVGRPMCSEAMPRRTEIEALLKRHPDIQPQRRG